MSEDMKVVIAKIHSELFGERGTIVQMSDNKEVSIVAVNGKYYFIPTDELVLPEGLDIYESIDFDDIDVSANDWRLP